MNNPEAKASGHSDLSTISKKSPQYLESWALKSSFSASQTFLRRNHAQTQVNDLSAR
jgi:hypothetical protein